MTRGLTAANLWCIKLCAVIFLEHPVLSFKFHSPFNNNNNNATTSIIINWGVHTWTQMFTLWTVCCSQ